jgi:hypothetical protein
MNIDEIKLAVGPYVAKLAAFDTADEIRDFLVQEEIHAVRLDPKACALAAYVRRGSGQTVLVCNDMLRAIVTDIVSTPAGRRITISTAEVADKPTQAMSDFIVRFDSGKYPELEAKL